MFRLLSLSVPSLGGNKMATKKRKNIVIQPLPSGGTIDLEETEKEMEALIGEETQQWNETNKFCLSALIVILKP